MPSRATVDLHPPTAEGVVVADDAEVRALVLARIWQGRLVRTADGLYDAATRAAEICERHVAENHDAADVADWVSRARHWRDAATRALDIVREWE